MLSPLKRRCDEAESSATIPPPSQVLNDGTDFRVAAVPLTEFKQCGQEQRLAHVKRSATALLRS